jgi:hypothetical protein
MQTLRAELLSSFYNKDVALAASRFSETTRVTGIPATLAVYWHLLSLDAPSVAALWSWSLARAVHLDLPTLTPLLLAVGTWLVYVADRILDGMDSRNRAQLRERHYFYLQHRRAFLAAGAVIAPIFAWIVFTRMAPVVRREDSAVFAVAALYFLLVHVHGRHIERWLPKELAVGVLFAGATAVPTWARIAGDRLTLIPIVALFAVLCWLNCVAIESWERGLHTTTAHRTTLWAGRHLRALASGTALLSMVLAFMNLHNGALCWLYLASALAGLLLFWLARCEQRLTAMQLRIAADAVLLTPLLVLAWML